MTNGERWKERRNESGKRRIYRLEGAMSHRQQSIVVSAGKILYSGFEEAISRIVNYLSETYS